MRLSYVGHTTAIPSRRAHSVQMMNACAAFASQGTDLRLLLPRGQKARLHDLGRFESIWEFYNLEPNFEILRLPFPEFLFHRRMGMYAGLACLYSLRRRDRLIYTRCLDIAFYTAKLGFPTVCESQTFAGYGGDKYSRLLPHWIELVKKRPRRAAMIMATRVDAEEYKTLDFPADRLLVVSNGLNPCDYDPAISKEDLRRALGLPQSKTIICYSGHLYEDKGIYEYLRCAKFAPDLLFIVVGGEPEDVERCRAFARERNIENIGFIGYVPHFEVARYLLAADMLVMPQVAHPKTDFPRSALKIFEYLGSGRPIVSTDFPSLREIFSHKRNALLVPPEGSEALAKGIRYLLEHPDIAEKLGRQARQDAKQYSWENRARRILSWSQEVFDI